ncbi:hypothetical protein ACA910_015982 [Epithemia clementina (nom. ined.)]
MVENGLRDDREDDDDNASSTFVLNIVAQPVDRKSTNNKATDNQLAKKKKKPKNKFERRRNRRAQEIQEQQNKKNPQKQSDFTAKGSPSIKKKGAGPDDSERIESSAGEKPTQATPISLQTTKGAIRSTQETLDEAFPEDYGHNQDKPEYGLRAKNIFSETVQQHEDSEGSKKQQHLANSGGRTDHNITDLEERARYMAEFHAPPMELDRRSRAAVAVIRDKADSQHLFSPNSSWSQFASLLHPRIVQSLQSTLGLAQPTLIQARTIPAFFPLSLQTATETTSTNAVAKEKVVADTATAAHNILIHSETGSGKTLAYLLPILQSLAVDSKTQELRQAKTRAEYGTRCLILCPTRELAAQTFELVNRLCTQTFHWIVPGCLLGSGGAGGAGDGSSRKSEKTRLRKGLGMVVATPGRLLDHLCKTESLLLALKGGKLEWVVLDEADRLLDLGLGEQVKQIVQRISANQAGRHVPWRSVLVSATVTPSVQQLATESLAVSGNSQSWVWVKGNSSSNDDKKRGKASSAIMATDKLSTKIPVSLPTDTAITDLSDDHVQRQTPEDGSDSSAADVDRPELADSTPRQLAQWHMTVTAKWRLSALVALLVQRVVQQKQRVVVFLNTCASVDFHYALFHAMESILDNDGDIKEKDHRDSTKSAPSSERRGIFGSSCSIYKLHGRVPHAERQEVLRQFLRGDASSSPTSLNRTPEPPRPQAAILLATDVAARGLNLHNCDWTIQYDPPAELSDYVHRAGRVARAGKAGHSLLFLLPSEREFLTLLKQRGIAALPAVSLSATLTAAATKSCNALTQLGVQRAGGGTGLSKSSGMNRRLGEAFCSELQRRLEDCVLSTQKDEEKKFGKQQVPTLNEAKWSKTHESKKDSSSELMELARTAFLSHIRAYPTREKCVKHVFAAKALHLGHVARSFALKETPKRLASFSGKVNSSVKTKTTMLDEVEAGSAKMSGMKQKKRNAAMAFERHVTDNNVSSKVRDDISNVQNNENAVQIDGPGNAKKKKKNQHTTTNLNAVNLDKSIALPKKNARSIMIENAKKLQGMDAF